jgi:hypothetical protein
MLVVAAVACAALVYRSADAARRERETYGTIADVHRAVHEFRSELGRCPSDTGELFRPPQGTKRFLRADPRDGWGRALWLSCPDQPTEPAYVVSPGPSGSFFVDDNIM